jgi:amino acid transporter
MSAFAPICIAGFMAAALSSALASLTSGAKVWQAVCRDRLFPFITVFEKGYGKNDEPRLSTALVCIIGAATCMIGMAAPLFVSRLHLQAT